MTEGDVTEWDVADGRDREAATRGRERGRDLRDVTVCLVTARHRQRT